MSLLTSYLKKIGVKSFEELNTEEKETYRNWEIALSGRKLTDKDVMNFLNQELEDSIAKLENTELSERADTFLKMKVSFIRKVKIFLQQPEIERQVIENQLKQ